MKNFRKQFPLLKQYTYLNTAASGLLSEDLLEFRQDHDLDFLISGSILKEKQGAFLADVRKAVGGFFNCPPNRVALTPNFSYGFNILLEGIEPEKKTLLLENDYPSINWAVEARDFTISYAKINENLEKNIAEVVKRERPDVFAFSLVQWINGIKIDLNFLKILKQEYPEMLIVADGTQYCGTEDFDFEASGIDVLGSSTYKWMNAGYGNAFFLFKESVIGRVHPKYTGFGSLQGKYKPQEGNFIGRFEPGHQDTFNFGSLLAAIKLIEKKGINKIEKAVKAISTEAREAFESQNLLESEVSERVVHSSLFNIKGDDALFQYLRSKKIICSQRGTGIRVSFHYFNTSEDLNNLLKALRSFKK